MKNGCFGNSIISTSFPSGGQAAKGEAAFLETFPVGVVEFVTMPMPFIHHDAP